jgi:ubiquinone/menaquinone biosynthesis C-methylase UbiE
MNSKEAKIIIKKVEKDYDTIAKEWDEKRGYLAPENRTLSRYIKPGQKILDAGCGNGVLYDILAGRSIIYTGLDVSAKLLKIAQARIKRLDKKARAKFVKGEVTKLPFKDKSFDLVFNLAVLHHVPSEVLRQTAVAELHRVLKSGGKATTTAWNLASDYAEERFHVSQQLKNPPYGWGIGDVAVPWKATTGKKIDRYVHLFNKKEMMGLFEQAGFKKISCDYVMKSGKTTPSARKGAILRVVAVK